MKTKIYIFTILLSLKMVPCFGVDHYEQGKFYFNRGNYKAANIEFKQAVTANPSNVNYRYYYVQTLVYLDNLSEAKTEYEKIISLSPKSEAARLSVVGIAKINNHLNDNNYQKTNRSSRSLLANLNSFDQKTVNNSYIRNVVNEKGQIVRWSTFKMPININVTGANQEYISLVKSASSAWESASGGVLKFNFTQSLNKVDVYISIVDKLDNKGRDSYVSGLAKPHLQNDLLLYSTVNLVTKKPNGEVIPKNIFYNTALHEIGHALGIWGHSEDKNDIMHPVYYSGSNTPIRKLTQRDINTIKLLYKLTPDISNSEKDKIAKTQTAINDNVLGNKEKRLQLKLNEALAYVKKVPDKAVSWNQLGAVYKEMGEYSKAETSYKKALSFDPTNQETFIGLAEVYKKKKDFTNTILTYKKLIAIYPKNADSSCMLANLYLDMHNSQEAKNVMNALLIKNPAAAKEQNVNYVLSRMKGVTTPPVPQ